MSSEGRKLKRFLLLVFVECIGEVAIRKTIHLLFYSFVHSNLTEEHLRGIKNGFDDLNIFHF